MVKKIQSIDGFTLKRRDDKSSGGERAFLNVAAEPKPAPKKKAAQPEPENISPSDIEESLRELEDADQSLGQVEPAEPTKKMRLTRKDRRANRANQKKRHPIRRVVKWLFILLFVIALAMVGWLAVKALITGGKVFQGNPLDILTSKTRLAEDKNGRTNVIIFGTEGYSMSEGAWDGALLTDSIMVVSFDQDKNDAYMVSLPRDLYVGTCTSTGKLNEIYWCGLNKDKSNENEAAAGLRAKAQEILGLDVQYYVHLNWSALVQGVDAVGGVDVKIESSDPRGIYDKATEVKYANGEVAHLNGERALALARARNSHGGYGLGSGNFDREIYQQKILSALQQKALTVGTLANPAAVNSLLDAIGDNLRTNFKTNEVQTLLDLAKKIKASSMVSLPLVNRENKEPDLVKAACLGEGSVCRNSIVRPVKGLRDYSDIIDYIKQSVSADPVTREAAMVDVLNGSEEAGLAQKKADALKEAGYKIGQVTNAPAAISDKVKIYQLSDKKPGTAAALEERFGVKITIEKLDGYDTKAAFVVVFGKAAVE